MTKQLGASATLASRALTAFWAMVTAGRVLFARIEQWLPPRLTYHLLPFVLAAALVAIRSPSTLDERVRFLSGTDLANGSTI